MFPYEIAAMLESGGVGVYGRTIRISSKAVIPPVLPSGGILLISTTGGPSPERTHNSVIRPAYVRPTAQLVAMADTFAEADALAHAAYDSLAGKRNYVASGGVFYREITPLQEPFDLGLDPSGRPQVAFSILAIKRPS
jgi:hypothetical protein